jgi:aldose 1-epimerase
MRTLQILSVLAIGLSITACQPKPQSVFSPEAEAISAAAFDTVIDNLPVTLYTLTAGKAGLKVTNYGARIVALCVPDATGKPVDVALGYTNLSDYLNMTENFFGAAIGRYGNRIANAKFNLDGAEYQLTINDGNKQLHGGFKGFNDVVWAANQVSPSKIEFTYVSKDGEEGYPGNLSVTMTYELTPDQALNIEYSATTDKATICNLTHHSYFNLNGEGSETILDHLLTINSQTITAVDTLLIPTGELMPVAGTPFDFNQAKLIGQNINDADTQLTRGFGYDHNFVIDKKQTGIEKVAELYSPKTKIAMEVYSDQPGIQFYSGNFLNGSVVGKSGNAYLYRSGLCLETQHFPDSPNKTQFPSVVLRPGETYKHVCIYKFLTK